MKRRITSLSIAVLMLLATLLGPVHQVHAGSETAGWNNLQSYYKTYGAGHYVNRSPWGVAYFWSNGNQAQIRIYQCSDPSNVSPFEPYTAWYAWVYPRPNNYNPTPLTFCAQARQATGSGGYVGGTLDWDGP